MIYPGYGPFPRKALPQRTWTKCADFMNPKEETSDGILTSSHFDRLWTIKNGKVLPE